MNRAVVPIAQVSRRLPEAGRLRFGVKTGRAMKAISTWRATSHDEEALRQVAALYGGEVKPWSDSKAAPNQFEVITQASEIDIVLPPDPLGGSPVYEMWTGGGCERRCDGVTCSVIQPGPDGPEPAEIECPCAAAGTLSCEPRLRLSVIIAGIRFGGVWRLETKSWNAVHEMPGMVDLIQSLQERGLTKGVLALKHRRSVTGGQTHQFIVPVLGVADSLEQIAAGAARLGALPAPPDGTGALAQLGEGSGGASPSPSSATSPADAPTPAADPDDEVVDAEIVEDGEPMNAGQEKALSHLLRTKRGAVGPTRWAVLSELLGREVSSSADFIGFDEAGAVIEALQAENAA